MPRARFNLDDFALPYLLHEGNAAYAINGAGDTVERLSLLDGERQMTAGGLNSTAIARPTSAAFGGMSRNRSVLYMVTSGARKVPVNGHEVRGGQVVAVRIGECDREHEIGRVRATE